MVLWPRVLFGQGTIEITSPASDLVVQPGQTIDLRVVVSGPLSLVGVGLRDPTIPTAEPSQFLKSPPYTFHLTIPGNAIPGSVVITSALYDPEKAEPVASDSVSVDIERLDSPREIKISGPSADLQVGSDSGVGVTGVFAADEEVPLSGSSRTIYEVQPEGIVSVTGGRLIALAPGRVRIVAHYENLSAAVGVYVSADSLRIIAPAEGAVAHPGDKVAVQVATSGGPFKSVAVIIPDIDFEYRTSAPYLFAFDVPAVKPGIKLISCIGDTASGSVSAERLIDIEPKDAPQTLTLDYPRFGMYPGAQASFEIEGNYANGSAVNLTESMDTSYRTTPPGVISVTPGLIKALAPGSATLTVQYRDMQVSGRVVVTDDQN